jgi:glyoxylate/hydroxypyruvate reductase
VVATRRLLPISQKRLEQQTQWDLVQWQEDRTIPREKLLNDIKGKGEALTLFPFFFFDSHSLEGAEALLCMLSDNIDKEILEAAGPQLKLVTTLSVGVDHIDLKTAKERKIKIGYTVRDPDGRTQMGRELT